MSKIERALLSVYDKSGLLPFARALHEAGVELISTGGPARLLRQNDLPVIELSDYTGFPEMLDGRVKTLHPKVHGGLLHLRSNPDHVATVQKHGIGPIDLVAVNLYPFEATVAQPGVTFPEAIENIDIGGPSMLRSAAKNHESVTVICDPADYTRVAEEIQSQGAPNESLRRELAAKVFRRTALYDAAIAEYLERQIADKPSSMPAYLSPGARQCQTPPYGEKPHQSAALYGKFDQYFSQLHGKALSYNNILDLTAAATLIAEFTNEPPTLAILKHTNPCGVGRGPNLREAWEKAFATDQQAPFGGIIAVNQPLDELCAKAIVEIFSEVIVAPDFSPEALSLLQRKKNLRLIRVLQNPVATAPIDVRSVGAESYLMQERDLNGVTAGDLRIVTKRQPTTEELHAMLFGWRIVKHVKSNAIVYTAGERTLGIGAGQMSRVDASRIAVWKANESGLSLKGSTVCSDAFFPFPDGLIAAADAGATAAIQPGGSKRDDEVIAAADERDMTMAFTGIRHFRH